MDMLEIMKKEEAYCSDHRDMPGELQKKAKMLCWRYNQTSPEEGDVRAEILRELLGTCHPLTFIEPSFRCDYGFNIHTHGLTVINYNCVILDTSPVHIGENAFIAPGVCIACSGHSKDAAQRAAGIGTSAPVTIGRDVWIGANSTVCGSVSIGDGTHHRGRKRGHEGYPIRGDRCGQSLPGAPQGDGGGQVQDNGGRKGMILGDHPAFL